MNVLRNLLGEAQALFRQRSPRERRALVAMAGVIAAAICIQLVWTVETGRRSLQRQLPVLADQAGRMGQLAKEWRALQADAVPRPEVVRAGVERHPGELGSGVRVRWTGDGELRLEGQVDFASWLRWTATMHAEHRMVLVRCRLRQAGQAVEIDAAYAAAAQAFR